jgi:ADP-ribose pyrophosphatase
VAPRDELLDSRRIFQGRILQVLVDRVRLPTGAVAEREIVRHPGAVGIVALAGERVVLVRQYRHAVGDYLLEIPAGKLDPGEDPVTCAKRELEEETGYRSETLHPLLSFLTSPGFSDERVHLFLTTDARQVMEPPVADGDEPISSVWLHIKEVQDAVWDGRIVDSKTIIGLVLTEARLKRAPFSGEQR